MSKAQNADGNDGRKSIIKNKRAFHQYEILERVECGIALQGSEVKSMRQGNVSFADSYAAIRDGQLKLIGLHIAEYRMATVYNHEPTRSRQLLAHRREIRKLAAAVEQKGLTLVPLALYWRRGKAKVEIGLARGKIMHDKRETIKKREHERDRQRALRRRR